MSTLTVTNINTANSTTDLTIKTGNTSAAAIILQSNGNGIVIQGNSTVNTAIVNTSAVAVGANVVVNTSAVAVGANVVVNTSAVAVGANVVVNTSSISIGNTSANLTANSTVIKMSDGSSLGTFNSLGIRNRIINGGMDVWQRGTSFSNPASGTGYTADRWVPAYDGTGATRTISQQSFTVGQTAVPGEPRYFLRFNQSVAGTGGATNALVQRIEGVRTLAGQTATLSFYAQSSTSSTISQITTYQNFGTGGSPSAAVGSVIATNIALTTSWQKYTYTFTVPSISGKTLGTNGDDFVELCTMYFPTNATFTIDIAQVQLEAGSVATPFERRPYGMELALCQRYYNMIGNVLGAIIAPAANWSSTQVSAPLTFPVQMRATPTFTQTTGTNYFKYDVAGSNILFNPTWVFYTPTKFGCVLLYASMSGLTAGQAGFVYTNDANALVAFSAEL